MVLFINVNNPFGELRKIFTSRNEVENFPR